MPDERASPDATTAKEEWIHRCDRCGDVMVEIKCKILCENCGFCRDCSDP